MKNHIFLFLMIGCFVSAHSQSDLIVDVFGNVSGKNLVTDSIIRETEYVFAKKITHSVLDSVSMRLTLQLMTDVKGKKEQGGLGNMLVFDLKKSEVVWDKPMDYSNASISQFGNYIIEFTRAQANLLNFNTGIVRNVISNSLYYVDPKRGMGFGYKTNFGVADASKVEGVDMKTGETRWKRKITHVFGWNNVLPLNDSVVLVTSDGLHSVNLQDGSGWDYSTATGRNDYSTTIAANLVGIGFGLLTGNFVSTSGHDHLTDLVSNVLADKSNIYFASKDKVTCLNHDGNVKWENNSAKKFRSSALVFIKDSVLYVLNKGVAFLNGRRINYGKPFLEAIDTSTGKDIFNVSLKDQNFDFVDYSVLKNNILILSENNIGCYSSVDGKRLGYKIFDTDKYGDFTGFVSSQIFVKQESGYVRLVDSESSKVYLTTTKNQTMVLNADLEMTNQYKFDDFYICYFSNDKFDFLARGDETIVLDKSQKEIAYFKASSNAFVVGNKLFEVLEDSLIEVDLTDLLSVK